jgi:hypothetical protein
MTTPNEEKRTPTGSGDKIDGPGPYLAKVKNHLDGEYMGRLEVELLKTSSEGNDTETTGQIVPVDYLSPFYGVTPARGLQENEGSPYTQNSYGFWAIPPDIDTTVLVIFAEGDRGRGFWIGCIQDQYMNFMIPGRASTTFNEETTEEKRPVNEYNKIVEDGAKNNPTQFIKPVDTLAYEALVRAGLEKDNIRGHTSSSARRETPSMVFGISSPGPADWRDGSPRVSYGQEFGQTQVPFNRLGGSTFVMDDGDPTLYRTTPPTEGPSAYATLADGGNPLYPANDLVRLKTRSGHQLLMHNSEEIFLIQHANGSYIEFTANGKIDIFAHDSINIHATSDINFKADRNINIEAGSAINIKSGTNTNMQTGSDYNLLVGTDGKIRTGGQTNFSADGFYVTSDPIHLNGPPATNPDATPSPTRVPQSGAWSGHENRNPAAHLPEQTENVKGTSSPPVNEDGTTAEQEPPDAGEVEVDDTFKQCTTEDAGTENQTDTTTTNPNDTKNPSKAIVTDPFGGLSGPF